jgi:hypothetical protein
LWLFAPAVLKGLSGMPFPFPGGYFPTKDETADYFEECVATGVARPRGSPRRAARDREVGADR